MLQQVLLRYTDDSLMIYGLRNEPDAQKWHEYDRLRRGAADERKSDSHRQQARRDLEHGS